MTDKPQFVGEKVASITIGELGKTQSGGTPSSKHPEYFDGEIPWIGTTALKGGFLDKTDAIKLITEEAVAKSATKIVPARSVMVGIRVGVGKVGINSVPMCTSQDVVSIVGIDERFWDKEYIALALKHKAPMLVAQAQGATITGITSKTLKAITIPIRSKDEQTRIVCQLNEIGRQLTNAERQIAKLDQLTKSRFVEMFGDLSSYEAKTLRECVTGIESGNSPKCLTRPRIGNEPAVLKLSALSSGTYREEENKALPSDVEIREEKEVVDGDILLARKNTPELVGRSVLVNHTAGNIMFPDIVFRMHVRGGINEVFLSHVLANPLFGSIRSFAHGSAKSMSNIPKSELAKLAVPLPPLSFQQEFADFAAQVDKSRFIAQQQIEKLQMLYDSLAQEYFGE